MKNYFDAKFCHIDCTNSVAILRFKSELSLKKIVCTVTVYYASVKKYLLNFESNQGHSKIYLCFFYLILIEFFLFWFVICYIMWFLFCWFFFVRTSQLLTMSFSLKLYQLYLFQYYANINAFIRKYIHKMKFLDAL